VPELKAGSGSMDETEEEDDGE